MEEKPNLGPSQGRVSMASCHLTFSEQSASSKITVPELAECLPWLYLANSLVIG